MSRAPYLLFGARTGWKFGDQKAVDAMIHDGLWCAFEDWHMGEAAEHIAGKCGVSRGRAGSLFRPEPAARRRGVGEGSVSAPKLCRSRSAAARRRRSSRATRACVRRRPPKTLGEAEAGFPRGRHGDGRQRLDAQRRRRRRRRRLRSRRRAAGHETAGAYRRLCDERRGAEGHLHRAGAGGAAGAGEGEPDAGATSICSS